MTKTELRNLIREEIKKTLKEEQVPTTLSALTVGDQFTLAEDAIASNERGYGNKILASKYGKVVFTVLQVTPKSVICTDGTFKGNSLSSPVDAKQQLPQSAYGPEAMAATKKLNVIKGTANQIDYSVPGRSLVKDDFRAVVFKPLKSDPKVIKVGHLN